MEETTYVADEALEANASTETEESAEELGDGATKVQTYNGRG